METWETGDQKSGIRETTEAIDQRQKEERKVRDTKEAWETGDKKSRKWSKMELRRQVRQEVQ